MILEALRVGLPVFFDRLLQQAGQMTYAKIVLLLRDVGIRRPPSRSRDRGILVHAGPWGGTRRHDPRGPGVGRGPREAGERRHEEGARLAVVFMALMGVIFFAVPGPLIRAFTDDPGVLEPGILYLRIVALLQVPLALTLLLAAAFADREIQGIIYLSPFGGCGASGFRPRLRPPSRERRSPPSGAR